MRHALPVPWLVAWRYIVRQRSRLLTGTARAALVATTLGVAAMVVALALMTGYTEDLERKLVGLQAEIHAMPIDPSSTPEDDPRLAAVAALPEVVRIGRVAYGSGAIEGRNGEDVIVFLRGVDPAVDPTTIDHQAAMLPDENGIAGMLLGAELARGLDVEIGETVRLVVMDQRRRRPRFRFASLRVVGTFSIGFAEFDSSWVVLDRDRLEALGGIGNGGLVELHLVPDADVDEVTATVRRSLEPDYAVQSPRALNRELFAALALQERLLFLVLGLIVLVSTFNIVSTLVILVRERMRDIGVLGALGMTPRQLRAIFVAYGVLLGAVGTLLGVAIGAGISWVVTTFRLIRFGPEVAAIYFIDAVPFRVEAWDLVAVVVFSLTVTFVACTVPARRAATILPASALRYE